MLVIFIVIWDEIEYRNYYYWVYIIWGRQLVMLNFSRCSNHNYSRFIAVLYYRFYFRLAFGYARVGLFYLRGETPQLTLRYCILICVIYKEGISKYMDFNIRTNFNLFLCVLKFKFWWISFWILTIRLKNVVNPPLSSNTKWAILETQTHKSIEVTTKAK